MNPILALSNRPRFGAVHNKTLSSEPTYVKTAAEAAKQALEQNGVADYLEKTHGVDIEIHSDDDAFDNWYISPTLKKGDTVVAEASNRLVDVPFWVEKKEIAQNFANAVKRLGKKANFLPYA